MIKFAFRRRGLAVLLTGLLSIVPQAQADTVAAALQRGDAAAARRVAEAEIKGRKDAGLLRAHLEGMIALRQGETDKAVQIFRAILAVAPDFQPAQQQLAAALQMQHQAHQNRPKPRKGGVGLRFGLLPSSNITGGVSGSTVLIGGLPFTIDPASRSKAGVGVSLGISGWHRWELGHNWQGVLQGNLDVRRYDTKLKPGETEADLRFDFGKQGPKFSFGFGPRINVLWQGGAIYQRSAGLGFGVQVLASPTLSVGVSGEWRQQHYPDLSYRNGHKANLMADMNWQITPKLTLVTQISGERETARAAHLSHRDLGLSMGVNLQVSRNTLLGLSLSGEHSRYDGLYPGFDVARVDDVLGVGITLQDKRISWRGVTPQLSISRKHQSSNIVFHDNWSTEFGLNLTKRF